MEQQTLREKAIAWWGTLFFARKQALYDYWLNYKLTAYATEDEIEEIYLKEHPQDTKEEVSLSVSVEDAANGLFNCISKEVEYIRRNVEKINEHSWKVYKEQTLGHIEEIEYFLPTQKQNIKALEDSHAELLELLSEYVSDKERIGWGYVPEHLAESKKAIETANKLNLK